MLRRCRHVCLRITTYCIQVVSPNTCASNEAARWRETGGRGGGSVDISALFFLFPSRLRLPAGLSASSACLLPTQSVSLWLDGESESGVAVDRTCSISTGLLALPSAAWLSVCGKDVTAKPQAGDNQRLHAAGSGRARPGPGSQARPNQPPMLGCKAGMERGSQ